MLSLQGVSYTHPNKDLLFSFLNLVLNKHNKAALIGNNGVGKSTLLKLIEGDLLPSAGSVWTESKPYYIPQLFGQYDGYTIAKVLQVNDKLNALNQILEGHATIENMDLLNNDWTIEARCKEALCHWNLEEINLNQKMESLSGGQKTCVFLAGIEIHQPEIVLMDEPTNHLDMWSRNQLYHYIKNTRHTLLVVSHDRNLLNLLDHVYELDKQGITLYGGNYDFYVEQKRRETEALNQTVKSKEKSLRKAIDIERESMERQQKLDARGKRKQENAGMPTIVMKALKNSAERSTAKLKGIHAEKLDHFSKELTQLRMALPERDKMKMDFTNSGLHKGKLLINAKEVNFGYHGKLLWDKNLDFQLRSGERLALKGKNGVGKTTIIKLILGDLEPSRGSLERMSLRAVYIDQNYSLVDSCLTVYERMQQFNTGELHEHEIKTRLNRFLFTMADWDKPCQVLSGGEKMRLTLCALTISQQSPDFIILDEPTNNLDIQNTEILTNAINEYQGTLLVVSHDEYFLQQIKMERNIELFSSI
ncbi:ATPase subunit of ABC transporter with duplicated ATPase domains [Pedobacter sp. CAN_A7]|uniref:ribosomal protection-like ABC-F family protein n=1 Tax=Pedobacter sp. CAN_A7 TaxID=2787722 RepID=UPI0018CAD248